MKKIYQIKNIDCQNCANKLEKFLEKELALEKVTINLTADKIILSEDKVSSFELEQLINQVEKAVVVTDLENEGPHEHNHGSTNRQLQLIIASFILFIGGLILKSNLVYLIAYLIVGLPVLKMAFKNIMHKQFFDEFFLMSIATLAAISIGELSEAVAVMIFYSVGEYMQTLSLEKTKLQVNQLAKMRIRKVNLFEGDKVVEVKPSDVKIKSKILVKNGEQVGIDSVLLTDIATFDMATLTGESNPVTKKFGDEIKAGSIALENIKLETIRLEDESTIAKLVELVTYADSHKTKTERFITRFSKIYTPIVVLLAIMIVVFLPLFTAVSLNEAIYRAVTLLVISCPCAFILSVPLGYVVAIGNLAKENILVKGSNAIDKLAKINVIASDKTGTLTTGEFKVDQFVNLSDYSDAIIHRLVNLGEKGATHPIAKSLVKYTQDYAIDEHVKTVVNVGRGIEFEYNNQLIEIYKADDIKVSTTGTIIAIDSVEVAKYYLSDEVRYESIKFSEELKTRSIDLLMLTGDNQNVANQVGEKLKLKPNNIFANLMPEDKLKIVESKLTEKQIVAFVGDGINDAAVIRRSDVGIAMGLNGSSLAIESADIVISNDQISGIIKAIKESQKAIRIIKQNITFAFIVKVCFIILGMVGIATMWEAVFSDVGVTIIAILNTQR